MSGSETVDLILARRRSGSQPDRRLDERKIALVIEGGGVRGEAIPQE